MWGLHTWQMHACVEQPRCKGILQGSPRELLLEMSGLQ